MDFDSTAGALPLPARNGQPLASAILPFWQFCQLVVVIWLAIVCLAPDSVQAAASDNIQPPAIQLDQLRGQTLLQASYQRTSADATLAQVMPGQWRPFKREDINQGIGGDGHWLRFRADNPSDDTIYWVIRGETSYLDNLTAYYRVDGGDFTEIALTDRAPFDTRPLHYRTLAIPLQSPARSTMEVYLRAGHQKPDTLSLQFSLYTLGDFIELEGREHLTFGIFYGALGIMLILSLLAAVQFRQANAVYYALFLGASVLFWLMMNGYGFQYLWPSQVYWHNEGFHLVFLGFGIAALQFSRKLLNLARHYPRLNRWFAAIQIAALAGVALRLAGLYLPVLSIAYLSLALVAVLIPAASYLVWRRGVNYAFWCLLAWIIYASGLLLSLTSAASNHLPWGMSSLVWLQLATVLETLCLMLAMINWVTNLEGDRKKAMALAHQDPLTGLGNRRLLQLTYTHLRNHFGANSSPLYLIMFDLDYFKLINDTYGHAAGDLVLQEFARLLRKSCRNSDIAVRHGGEEFALLVEAVDMKTACQLAERIRSRFADTPTTYEGETITHTVSCGAVEVLSSRVQLDENTMLRQADDALYAAKRGGRNRSVSGVNGDVEAEIL